jgi:Luciferase-like monooxygenase
MLDQKMGDISWSLCSAGKKEGQHGSRSQFSCNTASFARCSAQRAASMCIESCNHVRTTGEQGRVETMATYFKTPRFGMNIPTRMRPGMDPVAEALYAEQLGFDLVTIHRAVLHSNDPSFEIWMLLTWLAARTASIRLAPVVIALPNRYPAVLTKMAETLNRLSHGRPVLALGSRGAINEPAYRAFGLAQRSPREKVEALEEAIDILRGLWSTSDFFYAGQHFRTEVATIEQKLGH